MKNKELKKLILNEIELNKEALFMTNKNKIVTVLKILDKYNVKIIQPFFTEKYLMNEKEFKKFMKKVKINEIEEYNYIEKIEENKK